MKYQICNFNNVYLKNKVKLNYFFNILKIKRNVKKFK